MSSGSSLSVDNLCWCIGDGKVEESIGGKSTSHVIKGPSISKPGTL